MNNTFLNTHLVDLARGTTPMSIGDLFRFCFEKNLEKYGVTEKEYIRMIYQEVVRLRNTIDMQNRLLKNREAEIDRLRREPLFRRG